MVQKRYVFRTEHHDPTVVRAFKRAVSDHRTTLTDFCAAADCGRGASSEGIVCCVRCHDVRHRPHTRTEQRHIHQLAFASFFSMQ
jgi:hypothetical protein